MTLHNVSRETTGCPIVSVWNVVTNVWSQCWPPCTPAAMVSVSQLIYPVMEHVHWALSHVQTSVFPQTWSPPFLSAMVGPIMKVAI